MVSQIKVSFMVGKKQKKGTRKCINIYWKAQNKSSSSNLLLEQTGFDGREKILPLKATRLLRYYFLLFDKWQYLLQVFFFLIGVWFLYISWSLSTHFLMTWNLLFFLLISLTFFFKHNTSNCSIKDILDQFPNQILGACQEKRFFFALRPNSSKWTSKEGRSVVALIIKGLNRITGGKRLWIQIVVSKNWPRFIKTVL